MKVNLGLNISKCSSLISRRLLLPPFLGFLRFWKLAISPWMGSNCRFYPSCSEYAREALLEYGIVKGLWMSMKRIARCNSLCTGGYDPVHMPGSAEFGECGSRGGDGSTVG